MSKRAIPIRFTPKQKELVKNFLGKLTNEVLISPRMAPILKYGMLPPGAVATNIIVLTAEQKRLLQKEFNVKCDYIELTKEMTFR